MRYSLENKGLSRSKALFILLNLQFVAIYEIAMTDIIIDLDFSDPETPVTLRKGDRMTGIDRRHFSYLW